MKLKFDPNQQYQIDAVNAIVDLFEGQPLAQGGFESKVSYEHGMFELDELVVSNNLSIAPQTLIENLHSIQERNKLEKSPVESSGAKWGEAQWGTTTWGGGTKGLRQGMNFSVEMETGTGKTYVYLRTLHELNKKYGFKKFIIVVPSIAIKEGVRKNLEITREHFATLYDNPELDFFVYDSKNRVQTKNFAKANSMQIMVINIDSFKREDFNIIHQESDWGTPINYIKATNPIVILDEPQSMESEKSKQAIATLNPLCTLRYSATHRNTYNLVYRLTPVDAYDLGLVKKIEVDSIITEDDHNHAFVELKATNSLKTAVSAKISIDVATNKGVKQQDMTIRVDDDLYELSGKREAYSNGFIVEEIDPTQGLIKFTNGVVVYEGQSQGGKSEEIVKTQIKQTIIDHFEKEKELAPKGIKVLSLFFIDKVAHYRKYHKGGETEKGKFALWFEEAFKEVKQNPKYADVIPYPVADVHDGYFAKDRKGQYKDSWENRQTIADDQAYELIMRDKEKLLSMDTPLRFVFSHSALREGWDNPNVFQICTINETSSEIKKRQEIGRGLRLPVNQEGERVFDTNINVLTVIANEFYEDFARALQTEIETETGVTFEGRIKNKKKRRKITLRKGYKLDENFKDLWDKIKYQTRYQVSYSREELVRRAVEAIKAIEVSSPVIITSKVAIEMDEKEGVSARVRNAPSARRVETDVVVPNVLAYLQKNTKLTNATLLEVLSKAEALPKILKNPQQFLDQAAQVLTEVLQSLMVDGIEYEQIADRYWEMHLFEDEELSGYLDSLVQVKQQDKTLYDYVLTDSEVEKEFARDLESRYDVKFYFKLPYWFKIETPLGSYNPDWAVVLNGDKKVYFVAETKSEAQELRASEEMKIECGKKHFAQLPDVEFKGPIHSTSQLSAN